MCNIVCHQLCFAMTQKALSQFLESLQHIFSVSSLGIRLLIYLTILSRLLRLKFRSVVCTRETVVVYCTECISE